MNFIIPIAAPAGRAHASKAAGPAPVSPGAPEAPAAAWQAAVIRLARSTERLSDQIAVLTRTPGVSPTVIRDLIGQLVDWLDEIEGEPDLEDGGDAEPSLGSHEVESAGAVIYQPSWCRVGGVDCEEACDDEGVR